MRKAESAIPSIEQLLALSPRKRLEAWRAIQDPEARKRVARALPSQAHSEMLAEAAAENLNRNVLAKKSRKDRAA
jgi:hypothetical protein